MEVAIVPGAEVGGIIIGAEAGAVILVGIGPCAAETIDPGMEAKGIGAAIGPLTGIRAGIGRGTDDIDKETDSGI
jgi:hypothetical protein